MSQTVTSDHREPRLTVSDLHLSYGEREVITDASLDIPPGRVTSVIGPNGCGKSTLLAAIARQMRPDSGQVTLDGTDVFDHRPSDFARRVAMLPQSPSAPPALAVADLVGRGRHPHHSWFRRWTEDDSRAVHEALELTGTTELARRAIGELSGGQRQRVWLAMVLAQEAPVLLLDEPTTYLDLVHSLEILDVVRGLRENSGRTVLMVLHDLNLAARYSDHVVLLGGGGVVAAGPPAEVITADALAQVFRLRAEIITDPVTGGVLIVPDAPL